MTIKALVTVWDGDRDKPPEYLGEREFCALPRIDERIVTPGAGPWWDVLLVLGVEHRTIKEDAILGRVDPRVEIFVKRIGETNGN